MSERPQSIGLLTLLGAIVVAITFAFCGPATSSAAPTASVSTTPSAAPVVMSGTAPMPGDSAIPSDWLPPGSDSPDEGPSVAIFPPQTITLRFNHSKHTGMGVSCLTCHADVTTSDSAKDSLLPTGKTCDGCHGSDHTDPSAVLAGDTARGACNFCHLGYAPSDGNRVAPIDIPRPNLHFTHKKHIAKGVTCVQCHGNVARLELATRDQLPRMAGCLSCHQQPDSAGAHAAKSACVTCHLRELGESPHPAEETLRGSGGRIRTVFGSGTLKPPQWFHDSQHTPDWIQRHRQVAAADSQFCANCHTENYCTDCHDGRVRPRDIHPADFISMHPIEARMSTEKCTACHQEQSFCLTCHMRLGITMSGPPGVSERSTRFHPPKTTWSEGPTQLGSHGFEAERNLNACVSCHTERDCVTCHSANGKGGTLNPHRAGFQSTCRTQFRRNPRPCLVCHEPGDSALGECR